MDSFILDQIFQKRKKINWKIYLRILFRMYFREIDFFFNVKKKLRYIKDRMRLNLYVFGILGGDNREKEEEEIFKEVMVGNFF